MAIRLDDLPPRVREQAAAKILADQVAPQKEKKYRNQKTIRTAGEGKQIVFDSKKEAARYDELMFLQKAGKIRDLKLQPEFTLRESYRTADGILVRAIRYRADFSYEERVLLLDKSETWKLVVEDVKSEATKTRVYAIKKKLLNEEKGITIREV